MGFTCRALGVAIASVALVSAVASPATAGDGDGWNRRFGAALTLGSPGPNGYVGAEAVVDPIPALSFTGGLGWGPEGLEYGTMARARHIMSRATQFGLGLAYGGGLGLRFGEHKVDDPGGAWVHEWSPAPWFDFEGTFEMRYHGGAFIRLSIGGEALLTPKGFECTGLSPFADPAELAACQAADVPTGSPRVYFQLEFGVLL